MARFCKFGTFLYSGAIKKFLQKNLLFFQAEDGIRDVERSRGLGDVYKRQSQCLENIAYFYQIIVK